MTQLTDMQCEACRADAPRVSEAEMPALCEQVPQWQVIEREGVAQLERCFTFKNFQQALDFTNQVGALAESASHHPSLLTEWGRVTVTWWTHKIGGLHNNDFIMAARTDLLYS